MSSHVPFLALRPDDQFSTDVKSKKSRKPSALTAIAPVAMGDTMESPPPLTPAPKVKEVSRIPQGLRLPLLCFLSFTMSTLFHSLAAGVTGIQLATASRSLESGWEISVLLGWRVVELAAAWGMGYDYEDLAALTLLINQPYYYLLHAFWSIQLVPVLISLAFDILVVAVPFALLRPHKRRLEPMNAKTTNQALAIDWQIMILTAVLGATIYAVTFYISYQTNFSIFLINHFDDIQTLEAHDSSIAQLLQLFAFTGLAIMLFLFRPTIAASTKHEPKSRSKRSKKFNAETASLLETLRHNVMWWEGGMTQRAIVLYRRTAVLSLCTLANTFVRVYGTVEGTDIVGSLGYGALWATATTLVGVSYGLLSHE